MLSHVLFKAIMEVEKIVDCKLKSQESLVVAEFPLAIRAICGLLEPHIQAIPMKNMFAWKKPHFFSLLQLRNANTALCVFFPRRIHHSQAL
mmetsp:Transcript_7304/g.17887  ORF Transcript_7304/g.17887 Transcript_7304/m.17887 type:complete len:91 (-) Transcript_7304:287-559(-)